MTSEDGTELLLQSEEKDIGARPRRGLSANAVRRTIERMKTQERPEITE